MFVNTPQGRTQASGNGYWTNRKWFSFVAVFLVLWIGLYLLAHWDRVYTGYEYARFSTEQIQQINRILYNNDAAENKSNDQANATATPVIDTIYKDSSRVVMLQTLKAPARVAPICDDSCHINKAMLYIRSEFDDKIKEDQLSVIRQYIATFSSQEVGTFLADLKVKVRSYFWMTGPMVYMEIVFWVIIGVVCSIVFTLGNASRAAGLSAIAFSDNEIPYQVAKLFYAPFCTIILVLTYNYIKHRNVIEVNTNEGMIVFSFMAGLFSGRMMSLLDRFKDVLLPEHTLSSTAIVPTQTQYSNIASLPIPPPPPPVQHPQHAMPPAPAHAHTHTQHYEDRPEAIYNEQESDEIHEVNVELKLDVSGLFEEEKRELVDNGFASAVVTLHNVNGKDIITVHKDNDTYTGGFVAQHVKPGIYIVRSTLTQRLSNEHIMNLFGEKTVYITHENSNIELYIKKYEALD